LYYVPWTFPRSPALLRVTMIMDNAPEYCFMSRPYQVDYWEGLLHHLNHKILHEWFEIWNKKKTDYGCHIYCTVIEYWTSTAFKIIMFFERFLFSVQHQTEVVLEQLPVLPWEVKLHRTCGAKEPPHQGPTLNANSSWPCVSGVLFNFEEFK